MKLHEIHDEIEMVLAREVDSETGEITDETLERLDALEIDRDAAALGLARYLMGERAEAEAVKREAARLAERARGHEKRATRLLEWLEGHVPAGHKLSDEVVQLGWRTSTAVEVVDDWETALPENFIRVAVTQAPDKKALGTALKDGATIPGAVLVKRTRLSVK